MGVFWICGSLVDLRQERPAFDLQFSDDTAKRDLPSGHLSSLVDRNGQIFVTHENGNSRAIIKDLPEQILRLLFRSDGMMIDAYQLAPNMCCGPEHERPLDLIVKHHNDTAAWVTPFAAKQWASRMLFVHSS
jgi:hypothetical protein